MDMLQLEDFRTRLEAQVTMTVIVLVCVYLVISAALRLHQQSSWWHPDVKQRDFASCEKKLTFLLVCQLFLAIVTACALLLLVWTKGPLLGWSVFTLVLLACSLLLWWVRTRTWYATRKIKEVPYSDTQIG